MNFFRTPGRKAANLDSVGGDPDAIAIGSTAPDAEQPVGRTPFPVTYVTASGDLQAWGDGGVPLTAKGSPLNLNGSPLV